MVLKKGPRGWRGRQPGGRTVCGKFLLTRRERRVIELIRRHRAALSLPPLEAFGHLDSLFLFPSPSFSPSFLFSLTLSPLLLSRETCFRVCKMR